MLPFATAFFRILTQATELFAVRRIQHFDLPGDIKSVEDASQFFAIFGPTVIILARITRRLDSG